MYLKRHLITENFTKMVEIPTNKEYNVIVMGMVFRAQIVAT